MEEDIKPDQKFIDELKKLQDLSADELNELLYSSESNTPEPEIPRKLIDCQHEIVFTIIGNVLSQNEQGEIIDIKELAKKNFHIPVPTDQNYKKYLTRFFEYLEANILQTIDDTNNDKGLQTNE